jgi:hypothetical protein
MERKRTTEIRASPFPRRRSSRRRLWWRAQSASEEQPSPAAPLAPGASSPATISIRSTRSEKLTELKANSKLGPPLAREKSGSMPAPVLPPSCRRANQLRASPYCTSPLTQRCCGHSLVRRSLAKP